MSFEDFLEIHRFLSSQIVGTEFEDTAFYVGGCVRDIMLKRPVKDIDICISKPNGGIEFAEFLCKKLGIYKEKTNPVVFPQFGTAKFRLKDALPKFGDIEIETVQTRKEAYRDVESRKPETCFGTIKEDAERRDLTINAIYCKIATARTFDVIGTSEEDMKKHILRTPTNPNISFQDDALRILRVIRFSSTLGWGIHPLTWVGMCTNAYRLRTISKERIQDEFNKIITSPYASEGIRKLYWCGALKYIIPEFEGLMGMEQGKYHNQDVFEHSLTVMSKMDAKPIYRLAGLLHDIGKLKTRIFNFGCKISFNKHESVGAKLAEDILKDLNYPNATIKSVKTAIANHMRFKQSSVNPSNKAVRKFVNEIDNEDDIELCLALIDADNNSHAEKYCKPDQVKRIKNTILELENQQEIKVQLPINGNDIMEKFDLKKGPKIGKILAILQEYFYIKPKMTKEEAFNIVKYSIQKGEV